jgi:hypothetical protein
MKMIIEIPKSEDIEWQQDMLRELSDRLDDIAGHDDRTTNEPLDEAIKIVEALRQYSGY